MQDGDFEGLPVRDNVLGFLSDSDLFVWSGTCVETSPLSSLWPGRFLSKSSFGEHKSLFSVGTKVTHLRSLEACLYRCTAAGRFQISVPEVVLSRGSSISSIRTAIHVIKLPNSEKSTTICMGFEGFEVHQVPSQANDQKTWLAVGEAANHVFASNS